MSTTNIAFYEEMSKIIFQLSSNTQLICSSAYLSRTQLKQKEDELKGSYCKTPKFSDTKKLCCNLPKIQEKRPNLRGFPQKDANGSANIEDPDQTALLGAV